MELLTLSEGLAVDADGYLTVTINGVITGDMEVLRFQQNAAGGGKKEDYIAMFGSDEIAIKKRTDDGADTTYQLDFIVPGGALPAGSPGTKALLVFWQSRLTTLRRT